MDSILTRVQDSFRSGTKRETEDVLGEVLRRLIRNNLPTPEFIRTNGLDKEGVVSREVRTNVAIDGRAASINDFRIVGDPLTIVFLGGSPTLDDVVEIYFEDELVCRARCGDVLSDRNDLGIDEVVSVWKVKEKLFFAEGLWEKDLKKLFLCQEEELRLQKEQDSRSSGEERKNSQTRKFSEIKIEERPNDVEYEVSQEFADFRDNYFSVSPKAAGISVLNERQIFGVSMETGYSDFAFGLYCLGNGQASVVLSNGTGWTGIGEDSLARSAIQKLMEIAQSYLEISELVNSDELPEDIAGVKGLGDPPLDRLDERAPKYLPKTGSSRFHFLTTSGTFTIEEDEKSLESKGLILSAVFFEAHNVISRAREINQNQNEQKEQHPTKFST